MRILQGPFESKQLALEEKIYMCWRMNKRVMEDDYIIFKTFKAFDSGELIHVHM